MSIQNTSLEPSKPKVLPFYIVVDSSGSMEGSKIESVNDSLNRLYITLTNDHDLSNVAWTSIVSFAESPKQVVPLMDLSNRNGIPLIEAEGPTNYGALFSFLRDLIQRDIENVRAKGLQPYRPVIFFFTDGQPTDTEWEESVRSVHDSSWSYYPKILAFGLGDADSKVLAQIATYDVFMIKESTQTEVSSGDSSNHTSGSSDAANVIKLIFKEITKTIIGTVSAASKSENFDMKVDVSNLPGVVVIKSEPI